MSIVSTDTKGNMTNQADVIIRSEEDNHSVVLPITNSTTETTIQIKSENSVEPGNRVFTRWMNLREIGKSLWSDKDYRCSLLSYIAKIYGVDNIRKVLDPLRIEYNRFGELDQLYEVINELEKQPGRFIKR